MPQLDGTTNIQGRAAALAGAVFVHAEISATARRSRRAEVVDGLTGADLAGTGWPGPVLAQPLAGQFPGDAGTVNTAGTSRYAARADHRHAEHQATLDRIAALEAHRQHTAAEITAGRLDPARLPLADPPVELRYAARLTIDHTRARTFAVTATGPLSIRLRRTPPADGATVLLEVLADGVAVPVSFPAPTGMLARLTPPFVIPAGRLGLFGLRHSARAGRWTLLTAGFER